MGKGLLLTISVIGGEVIGACIPLLWGEHVLSFVSIVLGQVGAFVGFMGMYWYIDEES
jgi:hypothetical protein